MKDYVKYVGRQLEKCVAFLADPEDPKIDEQASEAVDNILRSTVGYYVREIEDGSDLMNTILRILVKE